MEETNINTQTTETTETTDPAAQGEGQAAAAAGEASAAKGEGEKLNRFQQFMQDLFRDKTGDSGEAAGDDTAGTTGGKEQAGADGKTYTQEDIKAMLDAERTKWQQEQAQQQSKEDLSPEEKIAELQAKLQQRELKDAALADLTKDGFPAGLAELLDYADKDSMEKSLASVKETFQNSLAAAVNQRLRGKTPPGLNNPASVENKLKAQISQNIRGGN